MKTYFLFLERASLVVAAALLPFVGAACDADQLLRERGGEEVKDTCRGGYLKVKRTRWEACPGGNLHLVEDHDYECPPDGHIETVLRAWESPCADGGSVSAPDAGVADASRDRSSAEGGPPREQPPDASPPPVLGRHIVVLRRAAESAEVAVVQVAQAVAAAHGATPVHVYEHIGFAGFVADMTATAAATMAQDPRVEQVVEDAVAELTATQTQMNAPWGLDRSDQRSLPVDHLYQYAFTGRGVHAYVIDSGINSTHVEFAGRVHKDFNALGGPDEDCNGHGTHVSGILGGTTYGIAKAVEIHAIRVFGCLRRGSVADVLAGVDHVIAHHASPAVANLSLEMRPGNSPAAQLLAQAVRRLIASGVTVVVAAGNDGNANACDVSPALVNEALTVAATDRADGCAAFSNTGPCVKIYGPGVGIPSAFIGSSTATATLNGTSMASPHVAGVAALWLEQAPTSTPAAVVRAIVSAASASKVSCPLALGGTPNLLLYAPTAAVPPAPAPPPPPPLAPGDIAVCTDTCTTPGHCYRDGVLVIGAAAQYCANGHAAATGLTATSTPQSLIPRPGARTVYRCADLCPHLPDCEPRGTLTVNPGACFGRVEDTGLVVGPGAMGLPMPPPGALTVQSCAQICGNLGQCLGYGQLTIETALCPFQQGNPTGLSVR